MPCLSKIKLHADILTLIDVVNKKKTVDRITATDVLFQYFKKHTNCIFSPNKLSPLFNSCVQNKITVILSLQCPSNLIIKDISTLMYVYFIVFINKGRFRCTAVNNANLPCKHYRINNHPFCHIHLPRFTRLYDLFNLKFPIVLSNLILEFLFFAEFKNEKIIFADYKENHICEVLHH